MRFPSRLLLPCALGLLLLGAVGSEPAVASPRAALTRDLDADGRIDAVDVAVRRAAARHVRVAGYRRSGAPRRHGRRMRLRLREHRRADSGARPRVRLGGRRVRARDRARPALVGVQVRGDRLVLAWSERVHTGRRRSARVRLGWAGKTTTVRVRVRRPARRMSLDLDSAVPPRRVVAGAGVAAIRDGSGNRAARSRRVVGAAGTAEAHVRRGASPRPASPRPVAPAPKPAAQVTKPDAPVTKPPAYPDLAPQEARPAGDFVDSIGVNVHLSYGSTAYGDVAKTRQALVDLGVRHIRDGACAGCTWIFPRFLELGRLGIRSTLIIGSPRNTTGTLEANLDSIRNTLLPAVEAVEGPNEYDAAGDPDWVAKLRDYQRRLYQDVEADPQLAHLDVIGPSFTSSAARSAFGDQSAWMTEGNMHPYPGGQAPGRNLTSELAQAALVAPGRPVVATETGYHNALETTSGHKPVSEAAAGVYMPDLFLESFRRGITRTFAYELVDERPETALTNIQQHFGLLRSDWTPKPAYTALQHLIGEVGDGTPAGGTHALRYVVAGGDDSVRQLLLERADGGYSLVLWRDVSVWDTAARKPIAVAPLPVTVRLGQAVERADVMRDGATIAWLAAPREVPVSLGAGAVVIRLATH